MMFDYYIILEDFSPCLEISQLNISFCRTVPNPFKHLKQWQENAMNFV